MSTPSLLGESFQSSSSEMDVSPVADLTQNLGGLRTESADRTPLRRWPLSPINTPESLPTPKWPLFPRASPEPSPSLVFGLLQGAGGPDKAPKYLFKESRTPFIYSAEDGNGSYGKENQHSSSPHCSYSSMSQKVKPQFFLPPEPAVRQDSEDSGCLFELDADDGDMLYSFGELPLAMRIGSIEDGIRPLDNSPVSSKNEYSISRKRTSWESGLPAGSSSSTRSSFLAGGDSQDGFPATLDGFFHDMESRLSHKYNDLISAPLSASVPRKADTPFHVYCESSRRGSKEHIRRRLALGSEDKTPESTPPRRRNTMGGYNQPSPSTPLSSLLNRNIPVEKNPFKRPVSPMAGTSSLVKRPRSDGVPRVMSCYEVTTNSPLKALSMQRCHSVNEASIKLALLKSDVEPDLIGDFSRPYALPLTRGKHDDLKTISPMTLAEVLQGKYSQSVKDYAVIDCRYPYEYEGGHIQGAVNIYTREELVEQLLQERIIPELQGKVLVFHCEFSSERAPKLARLLRNLDRQMHSDVYPRLRYPEIYVLEGGYRAFFESCKVFCVPETYMPMRHKDYENELKAFRAQSKSSGSLKVRELCALVKKF